MKKVLSLTLILLMLLGAFALVSCQGEVVPETPNGSIDEYEQRIKDLEKAIEDLNKVIADLEKGLANAEDVAREHAKLIEMLKLNGIELEDWNEATILLLEKVAELQKKVYDYYNSCDEDGNRVVDEANFEFVGGWYNSANKFLDQAQIDLIRATSVEGMDKIIADCLAACKAIKTDIEVLYDTVAAVEADGVTADDKENMMKSLDYFKRVAQSEYAGETTKERTEAQKALNKRIQDALKTYKVAATDKYVAMVAALPTVDGIKISDYYRYDAKNDVYNEDEKSALKATYVQYAHLVDDLGLTFPETSDPVNKAHRTADTLLARVEVLKGLKIWADTLNKNLSSEHFANTLGNNFHDKFGLNNETILTIVGYETFIANKLIEWEDQLDVVLDPDKAGFNEYIYNFIDHSIIEGYRAKYDALVEVLAANAQAYIEAVENIYAQTTYADIEAANVLAYTAFKALKATEGLTKNTVVKDIDVLLENEENEVANAAADHTSITFELAKIKNNGDELYKHVYETILSLKHVANCEGGTKCVCTEMVYNSNLNYTTIKNVVNTHLYPMLTTEFAFTAEELLGEEFLADLKAAFVQAAKNKVEASVQAWAESVSLDEGLETQVIIQITKLYLLDLDEVVFSATYTEPEYDFEGNVTVPGFWSWSEETLAYFATVDAYCDTALYNDICEGYES